MLKALPILNGMNEFTAKKLGEVVAFAKMGNDTIEKSKKIFGEFLSDLDMSSALANADKQVDEILAFATEHNILDAVKSEADKTSKKIESMRDLYIGDEWGNSSVVFGWWGFFGGAAIAHWNLVKGIGEAIENDVFVQIAYNAIAYHENLYDTAVSLLAEIGRNKSL